MHKARRSPTSKPIIRYPTGWLLAVVDDPATAARGRPLPSRRPGSIPADLRVLTGADGREAFRTLGREHEPAGPDHPRGPVHVHGPDAGPAGLREGDRGGADRHRRASEGPPGAARREGRAGRARRALPELLRALHDRGVLALARARSPTCRITSAADGGSAAARGGSAQTSGSWAATTAGSGRLGRLRPSSALASAWAPHGGQRRRRRPACLPGQEDALLLDRPEERREVTVDDERRDRVALRVLACGVGDDHVGQGHPRGPPERCDHRVRGGRPVDRSPRCGTARGRPRPGSSACAAAAPGRRAIRSRRRRRARRTRP